MIKFIAKVQGYIQSKDGATAIEYGLIAGGISLAIVAALFAFGDQLGSVFNTMSTVMGTAAGRIST